MKKIIVFSDCHWNSMDPSNVLPEFGENVFYIGDNHELKNVPKKSVKRFEHRYLRFLNMVVETRTNHIPGNHEISLAKGCPFYILKNGVLFEHGHRLLWSREKVNKWESMTPGKNIGMRLISCFGSKVRTLWPGPKRLSKKKIELAIKRATQFGAHTIVFGHTHPQRVLDETHNEIRIINVPRGRTEIII